MLCEEDKYEKMKDIKQSESQKHDGIPYIPPVFNITKVPSGQQEVNGMMNGMPQHQ
jgi:hypothetical protein